MRNRKEARREAQRAIVRDQAAFVGHLVDMLEDMIPKERMADFDANEWVARWLETPQPALAGAAPKDYLDTAKGRAIVKRLLGTIESGAYV